MMRRIHLAIVVTTTLAGLHGGFAEAAPPAPPTRDGVATLPGGEPNIPHKVPRLVDYRMKLADEKYYLYIPPNYRHTEPFGLLVFIHSGDSMTVPDDWRAVLARRKLLYIAPQNVGNKHYTNRRAGVAVKGLAKMMELCRIDPNRVYVTGMSGGARVACMTAFAHPGLIRGALPMCGAEFPAPVPKVKATRNDPYGAFRCDPNLVEQARRRVGFALITGPGDFRYGNILDIYNGGYVPGKFRVKFLSVRGMGHVIAGGAVIDAALAWVEASSAATAAKAKPAARRRTQTPPATTRPQPAGPAKPPAAKTPDDPEARAKRQLNLADNYRRAGLEDKALDILRRVIKDYPDTDAAGTARRWAAKWENEK